MFNTSRGRWPTGRLRPKEVFAEAEQLAIQFRKLLRTLGQDKTAERSGSVSDAVKLCTTLERLARWGKGLTAEEAIDLTEDVLIIVDTLRVEVDALLALHTQHGEG